MCLLASVGITILTPAAVEAQATIEPEIILSYKQPRDEKYVYFPVHPDQSFAEGFTMPARSYALTEVTVLINENNNPQKQDVIVSIYSDNGKMPGSPVAPPLSVTHFTKGEHGHYTCKLEPAPSGPILLAANTRYWLVATATTRKQRNLTYGVMGAKEEKPEGVIAHYLGIAEKGKDHPWSLGPFWNETVSQLCFKITGKPVGF